MDRDADLDGMIEDDNGINISDVIEVIQNTDPLFGKLNAGEGSKPTTPTAAPNKNDIMRRAGGPYAGAYVEIVEQPASKAMRFRYECEGRSAGSIPGQNSTPENKTFPTIRVNGFKGKAVVVVSCVTKDEPYRPHPHNLVGKEGCRRGVCTVEIPVETMTVTFSNLGIRCVKKKDIDEALRIREEIRVDPFRTKFAHRNQPSSIDLNAVRLCFQVFLEENGKFSVPLDPVVSEPIYDKKANTDLTIFELSSSSCSVLGGKRILLFCEKVTKDDIAIRFFEQKNGQIVWEGFADFQPSNVHRQVGISFTTPSYRSREINEPVNVQIQLLRPSDRAASDPLTFTYKPLEKEADMKRKRPCSDPSTNNYYRVEQLQRDATNARATTSPFGLNIPCEATIKVEPRETQNRMYGGGLSPCSSSSTVDAMHYRLNQPPMSVSPGKSPSPLYHHQDTTFGGTATATTPHTLHPTLHMLASPNGSLSPSGSSMDAFGQTMIQQQQWNIKQDPSSAMQWNILPPNIALPNNNPLTTHNQQQWNTFGPNNNDQMMVQPVAVDNAPINDLDDPTSEDLRVLDLDSREFRQCSLNTDELINNFDVFDEMSENLTNNLSFTENSHANQPQQQVDTAGAAGAALTTSSSTENLTDSGYLRLAASTINSLSNLYKTNDL